MNRPQVIIYTDGACSNLNGGWAASLYCGYESLNLFGNESNTTNNRMELFAVIRALEVLTTSCEIQLFSDSQYVLNGMTSWARLWQKNNWKNKQGISVQNRDLWERLLKAMEPHVIKPTWVRGHNGNPLNEAVDSLAQRARTLPV